MCSVVNTFIVFLLVTQTGDEAPWSPSGGWVQKEQERLPFSVASDTQDEKIKTQH